MRSKFSQGAWKRPMIGHGGAEKGGRCRRPGGLIARGASKLADYAVVPNGPKG